MPSAAAGPQESVPLYVPTVDKAAFLAEPYLSGYNVPASQSYEAGVLPNLKEIKIPESEVSISPHNISIANL